MCNRHAEAARVLVDECGADPHRAADDRTTPLAMACLVDDLASAEMLLAHGADPNAARATGSAPIHFAALHNNARMLTALLAAKAHPSLENGQRLTALKASC